jgi:hypothetical protein
VTTHHLKKDFQFPPKFKQIPLPPKLTCQNSRGCGARFEFTIYLSKSKQISFSMSEIPNYEKDSFKSFINILRAHGLNQQRESNIGVVKSFRSKTKILAYHPEQGGHLRVTKEELQKLEVD